MIATADPMLVSGSNSAQSTPAKRNTRSQLTTAGSSPSGRTRSATSKTKQTASKEHQHKAAASPEKKTRATSREFVVLSTKFVLNLTHKKIPYWLP